MARICVGIDRKLIQISKEALTDPWCSGGRRRSARTWTGCTQCRSCCDVSTSNESVMNRHGPPITHRSTPTFVPQAEGGVEPDDESGRLDGARLGPHRLRPRLERKHDVIGPRLGHRGAVDAHQPFVVGVWSGTFADQQARHLDRTTTTQASQHARPATPTHSAFLHSVTPLAGTALSKAARIVRFPSFCATRLAQSTVA